MSAVALFADDPVDGSNKAPDRLGRAAYADHVVRLLDRVRNQSESSVLALIGPWGSGKSSILEMIERKISGAPEASAEKGGRGGWLTASFNPWNFCDSESLQNGFFQELRNVLPKGRKWSDARKRVGELGEVVAPYGSLIPGVRAEGAIRAAGQAIAGDQGVAKVKRAAERALREFGRPILFVLDDLDRLTPEELLLVFKLVRLVGRLPNVYYLLSYDESTLLDILSRTDLVGREVPDGKHHGREYLEKIIQVRLDLPGLRESQALELVDSLLNHILASNSIRYDERNFDRFRTAFHDHIRRRLTTPRAINRYFAQVEAFYVLLEEEIDFIDFLLLTWVRTAEPELYSLLYSMRSELTDSGASLFKSVAQGHSPTEALEEWTGCVRECGVSDGDLDGVLAVLSQMFLPVRSARDGMTYGDSWYEEVRFRRGVGHIDYFDRYFSFGVPDDDIPDALVRRAMRDLASDADTRAKTILRARLLTDTARVCRKLMTEHERSRAPTQPLLAFLADLYGDLPAASTPFLDSRKAVQLLALDLLPDVEEGNRRVVLRRMSQAPQGVRLVAAIIAKAQHGTSTDRGKKTIQWLAAAVKETRSLIRAELDSVSEPLESLDEELWSLVWAWRQLDEDEMRSWVRDAISHKPGWSLPDVLARLVPPASMDGIGLPALSLSHVEVLIGVEFALHNLPPLDDGDRVHPSRDLEPTWENRIRLARSLLEVERQKRAAAATQAEA